MGFDSDLALAEADVDVESDAFAGLEANDFAAGAEAEAELSVAGFDLAAVDSDLAAAESVLSADVLLLLSAVDATGADA